MKNKHTGVIFHTFLISEHFMRRGEKKFAQAISLMPSFLCGSGTKGYEK